MMKKRTVKRIATLCLSAVLTLGLAACGGAGSAPEDGGTIRVAVIKQMDHPSLDEIAGAIGERMEELAAEQGLTIDCEVRSGQGDQSVLRQLGSQAIAEGADVLIPIATLAAQVTATCAQESGTPVVYASVSDPETAGLTGLDFVTGTSDALDTDRILDMMETLDPELTRVGLLYSLSEPNSEAPIRAARERLDRAGIAYEEAVANTTDEVISAVSTLIHQGVDAVFTPTDNIIMSAELAISAELSGAGIPHYTGADSFVRSGAFAACGVNYTQLGRDTADLALRAATEGMEALEDFYLSEGNIITVNTETANALGLDYAPLKDAFPECQVQEVETTAN